LVNGDWSFPLFKSLCAVEDEDVKAEKREGYLPLEEKTP
jgi:hypothetical protein